MIIFYESLTHLFSIVNFATRWIQSFFCVCIYNFFFLTIYCVFIESTTVFLFFFWINQMFRSKTVLPGNFHSKINTGYNMHTTEFILFFYYLIKIHQKNVLRAIKLLIFGLYTGCHALSLFFKLLFFSLSWYFFFFFFWSSQFTFSWVVFFVCVNLLIPYFIINRNEIITILSDYLHRNSLQTKKTNKNFTNYEILF